MSWQLAIIDQIRRHFALYADGEPGPDVNLVFTPWGYPAGSQLHWNKDKGADKIGAFIFYVHRGWKAQWGGGLAIALPPTDPIASARYGYFLRGGRGLDADAAGGDLGGVAVVGRHVAGLTVG